jgi:hypothetical protein
MLLNKVKRIIRLFFTEDFGQGHQTVVPQAVAIILWDGVQTLILD